MSTIRVPDSVGTHTSRPADDWSHKLAWLRSLGIDSRSIRKYALNRPQMSHDAWIVMVKECIRTRVTLTAAQQNSLRRVEQENELYADT